jgi:hypothetical protein
MAISIISPANRVRRTFIRLGLCVSASVFTFFAGTGLIDQWIAGYMTARFMLGTALVIAGACAGLFVIVAGVGLAVSFAYSEEPLLTNETGETAQRDRS